MNSINILGYAAATCTTGAYLPQAVHVWRSRSAEDVSLRMLLLSITGNTMWLVFGFLTESMPLIVACGITIVLGATILVGKLKYG